MKLWEERPRGVTMEELIWSEEIGDWVSKPQYAFCDNYSAHEAHGYTALNGNVYQCSGMTAEELTELEAAEDAAESCEHGLSLALCGGPMHYYD